LPRRRLRFKPVSAIIPRFASSSSDAIFVYIRPYSIRSSRGHTGSSVVPWAYGVLSMRGITLRPSLFQKVGIALDRDIYRFSLALGNKRAIYIYCLKVVIARYLVSR
jgi:hypothetical protein